MHFAHRCIAKRTIVSKAYDFYCGEPRDSLIVRDGREVLKSLELQTQKIRNIKIQLAVSRDNEFCNWFYVRAPYIKYQTKKILNEIIIINVKQILVGVF